MNIEWMNSASQKEMDQLQNNSLPLFSGVIQLLIQYRVTVEQEAFLL